MTRRCRILTANLQFTFHHVFSAGVDCFARVHSPVERTRLPDLQRQDAVLAEHPVLGFVCNIHLVFVPGHFGLTKDIYLSLASVCVNIFDYK